MGPLRSWRKLPGRDALAALGVIAAGWCLASFGNRLPSGLRLAGWGLLALAAVWLLRGGLFGPVVVQDAIRTARRGRLVFLRTLYASLLLLVLLVEQANAER